MITPITYARLSDITDLVRVVVRSGIRYRHTMDSALRHGLPPMERELLAKADALWRELHPTCPKCGGPMTGGAPHGPWPVQYECRRCGTVVVPAEAEAVEGGVS